MKSILASALFLTTSFSFAASAQPDAASAAREIDAILAKDWAASKLAPNAPSDDSVFVRRIYLDVVGRIPTTREVDEFIGAKEKDKRAKLIDKLLASEGYVQHFFNYWADVLRAQTSGPQAGQITGAAYTTFLKQSLRDNKPYDKFVQDMVAAQGKAWGNGAIGYYMRDRGMPLDNMANTVRVFLGTRIECAQCHNHPFDKWTQMQFYKMASFTFGVQTQDYESGTLGGMRELMRTKEKARMDEIKMPDAPKRTKQMTSEEFSALEKKYKEEVAEAKHKRAEIGEQMRAKQRGMQDATQQIRDANRYTSVSFNDNRKASLPHDYKYDDGKPNAKVDAGTMMGHECITQPGETPLEAYARWMTGKDNPRFTTVIANRLWKRAFGLALIEPLDELMDNTVAANPELEKRLEKLMRDLNYDMKAYLRVLYNTSTYQRQVTREEVPAGVTYHFTGPVLRRMSPEQMWDSFVTLINPNPDMPNVESRESMAQRVTQAKKVADSVDSLTPEEMLAGLETASKKFEKTMDRTRELQKEFASARKEAKELEKEADKMTGAERDAALAKAQEARDKSKALSKELNGYQADARKAVVENVMIPGQKRLYQKVTGKAFEQAMLKTVDGETPNYGGGGDMMMMASTNGKAQKIMIPGYDKEQKTKEQLQADREEHRKVWTEEAAYYGIPAKQVKDYVNSREQLAHRWLRSAELESPAPRGHHLREFGQSDRETIENSNSEASVPQALAMMNGELMPQITGAYSQLMLTIRKAQYPDDKIEAAYMAILARKPTAKEKEVWLQAQDKGLSDMDDLVYALLNTQQFIFIQ